MLHRAHLLSSSMNAFTQECQKLEWLFLELKFPESLMDDLQKEPTASGKPQVSRIVLPFKCQQSANTVRRQTSELSTKISVRLSPVFTSSKLNDVLKPMEQNAALVSKQKVVYHFQCIQCEAGYVSTYTEQ